VLVVEDEAKVADAVRRGLEAEGFAVDVAPDGNEGLWRAEESAYDVIVLDILLPGLNGYRVCRQLREAENWTPILMLTARGAVSVEEPHTVQDEKGEATLASIAAYGDTIHTFVERSRYNGAFLPGFRAVEGDDPVSRPAGLKHVDHMVGNVGRGEMNRWVDFYRDVMGFRMFKHFDDKDISTEYSALMSKVMSSGNERVKFPINEPAPGKRKSQIEEYLEYYHGPGVQHIAMATDNIIETVSVLRRQGVDFLRVPSTYYDDLIARTGPVDEPIAQLRELGILVDRDDEGYMLQIFSKPVEDRPTLFYEIIQRKGSRSFGKGNFKALFEAIEREQALRGNL
jgi:4-hydroxyphenylpyruvate dioxygenase